MSNKKGQGGLVAAIIGLTVAVIVGVAAAIPITLDVVNQTSSSGLASGTTLTILNLLPLGFAIVLLVAIFAVIALRR